MYANRRSEKRFKADGITTQAIGGRQVLRVDTSFYHKNWRPMYWHTSNETRYTFCVAGAEVVCPVNLVVAGTYLREPREDLSKKQVRQLENTLGTKLPATTRFRLWVKVADDGTLTAKLGSGKLPADHKHTVKSYRLW